MLPRSGAGGQLVDGAFHDLNALDPPSIQPQDLEFPAAEHDGIALGSGAQEQRQNQPAQRMIAAFFGQIR